MAMPSSESRKPLAQKHLDYGHYFIGLGDGQRAQE